jgi:thioesterase domain-containing protein
MFGEFLDELKKKEIEISFTEGKIIYAGPEENITPEFIGKIKEFKGDLIKYYWPHESKNMMSINPGGTKTSLMLIYCGNLSYFISDYLGSNQPIYGFFDDGWLTGEKSVHSSVESIAKEYINQLKKVLPNGPFVLGGHSFGGVIAYEMAVQLQKSGYKVPFITLFDSMSPYANESFYRRSNVFHIYKSIFKPIFKKLWQFLKMPVFNTFFLIRKRLPKSLRPYYIVTNYLILLYKYRPEKFNGNILLFKVNEDNSTFKYYYGWESLSDKVENIVLEGNHLSMMKEKKYGEIIGKEIEKLMDNVEN